MSKSQLQKLPLFVAFGLMMGIAPTTVRADPMAQQPYSVIDLGLGTPTFSTTSTGAGIVSGSNGQSYLFTPTVDTTVSDSGSQAAMLANFPNDTPAPVNDRATYGNPASAFSNFASGLMNSKGVVAALETYGVGGEWTAVGSSAAQHNANGTWTNLGSMPFFGPQSATGAATNVALTAINNLNQVLGYSAPAGSTSPYTNDTVLFNISTQKLVDFSTAPYMAGYTQLSPIALDDQGRVILTAWTPFSSSGPPTESTFLLTPTGVVTEPLVVPAPEPGTVAVMLMAIAGFGVHRLRERRRQ